MKREILCKECCENIIPKIFNVEPTKSNTTTANPYPLEYIKLMRGEAKNTYLCDMCGVVIEKDQICYAFSIWSDRGGIPYYEWEEDFINY